MKVLEGQEGRAPASPSTGNREEPATKALVSMEMWWWWGPQTIRELWKSTGSSAGGGSCHGSNGSEEEAFESSGSFRDGGRGLVGGSGEPGLEGQLRKMRSMLGNRGFIKLTGQKAEPVGLKCTLFLSGQEERKARSGPGDVASSNTRTLSQPSGGSRLKT